MLQIKRLDALMGAEKKNLIPGYIDALLIQQIEP
jgi:hypothetical protein